MQRRHAVKHRKTKDKTKGAKPKSRKEPVVQLEIELVPRRRDLRRAAAQAEAGT